MSKRGENIYKRKDGRWEARYIKGHAPNGDAKYGYCYAKSYREVRLKLDQAKAAVIKGRPAERSVLRKRLCDFCDEWMQLKRSTVKQSTYVKYQSAVENHIKAKLGGCFVSSLTSIIIEEFGFELMNSDGLSVKTVRDILTVLSSILSYAEKQLPFARHIEVIYPKAERKEMRVLTRDEQERFTKYLLSSTDHCKFGTLLALLTGLRIGEVCALRWCDISIEEGVMKIGGTMQRLKISDEGSQKRTRVIISDPKSFSSSRVIPLSPFALELCRRFRQDAEAYVLTGEPCRYIEPRILQYRMEKYTQDCELSGVHFHTLRHSFATRCVEVGFEIKSLSEVLGHASPQITLERYVHSSLELKRENMNKLSALGY